LVPVGEVMDVRGGEFVFQANGDFTWTFPEATAPRPKNLDVFINQDPVFGTNAFVEVLFEDENVPNALISSFIVTIPATIIPITIAAFAAYAFAWMSFPGRDWLFVIVVSLMVVPTQLAFLPILTGFSGIASWATQLNAWLTDCEATNSCQVASKTFASLWITHTAFGLPLAIYLLRNYIVGLPKELLESARIDGANHLQIFTKMIVPLSVPALASFSIFQFLWVWNDLIVALYIGPNNSNDLVFPIRLQKQLGTFKDQLHLLNASAVISMVVPVIVFLSMQRYFIRGLLAGSVKGG
ncbi:MAG: carbohydrate ABC transporter permease, partial [Paracoccaceae bacterium]